MAIVVATSLLLLVCAFLSCPADAIRTRAVTRRSYTSAVGDPGMRRDGLRVAWEAWNFCNEVGEEAPGMPSPRGADCFDLVTSLDKYGKTKYKVVHRVKDKENNSRFGDVLSTTPANATITNVDLFAAAKELSLGDKCQVNDTWEPWQFWMIMLKNGNLDTTAGICPENGRPTHHFPQPHHRFPCPAGKGCMNQPLLYHNHTTLNCGKLQGGLYGTYDLDVGLPLNASNKRLMSYFSVTWEKEVFGNSAWVFHHKLRISHKYPWLMLYLRSDATKGYSGGYHYETRGMTKIIPESPDFKVRITLEVKQGGGPASQFYLMDMGSCWKNNGAPCDGDVTTDVTRYSEMIINPATTAWCRPNRIDQCPPWHTFRNGTRVHRTDIMRFPYAAYHVYCSPGNARHAEMPMTYCDPYSNPQPQEILQILPHPVWGEYGYPTEKGQGWVGDPRAWELDVGAMSHRLYFYQDPGTPPARRQWTSLDVGTEIYKSDDGEAEWTLSGFDILVPKQ